MIPAWFEFQIKHSKQCLFLFEVQRPGGPASAELSALALPFLTPVCAWLLNLDTAFTLTLREGCVVFYCAAAVVRHMNNVA